MRELKGLALMLRLYRDDQGRWVRRIGIVKAVASSGTIAAWSIWKDYALAWGIILALAQLIDAVKEYIPEQKKQRAASDLAETIDFLFIDAQFQWNSVKDGSLDSNEIMARWRKLAMLRLEAERKFFPDGIPGADQLRALAQDQSDAYFRATYGAGDRG
jgi:hypothetical protein